MGLAMVPTTEKHQEEGASFVRICELFDEHHKRERMRKTKRKSIYSKAILSDLDASNLGSCLLGLLIERYIFSLGRRKEKKTFSTSASGSPPSLERFQQGKKCAVCHSNTSHFINEETRVLENVQFGKKLKRGFSAIAFGSLFYVCIIAIYGNNLLLGMTFRLKMRVYLLQYLTIKN